MYGREAVGDVLVKALALVAVVGIGYGFKRLGWLKQEHFSILAIIVLRITLPAALITSFNTFTITGGLLWLVLIGFTVNLVQQGVTWLTGRRRPAADYSFAILHSGSYNVGAFAMPYTAQLVGSQAIVYTAMFDIGSSISAGGIGYGWGLSVARGQRPTWWRFLATMVRSPVFDTYLALFLLRLVGFTFPAPVITFTSLVGAANPFCAMLMIGIGLELRLSGHQWRQAAMYLARRYVFTALFGVLIWYVLPAAYFSHEVKVILLMVLCAPVAAMVAGFVDEAGGDTQLSSLVTSVSIIIAIVLMPAVYLLAGV